MTAQEQSDDLAFLLLRNLSRNRMTEMLREDARSEAVMNAFDRALNVVNKDGTVGKRWAVILYYRLCSEAGIQREAAHNFFVHIGARSEEDARRKVEIVNEAENQTPEQQVDEMITSILSLASHQPELAERACTRLGMLLHRPLLLAANGAGI